MITRPAGSRFSKPDRASLIANEADPRGRQSFKGPSLRKRQAVNSIASEPEVLTNANMSRAFCSGPVS